MHIPAMSTGEGKQAVDIIVERKKAQIRRSRNTRLALSALAAAGVVAGVVFGAPSSVLVLLGVFAGICVLGIDGPQVRWTEHEYYTVPGARDSAGQHRCLHCGHQGIYRHSKYKTSTTLADCSKCEANLWVEKRS